MTAASVAAASVAAVVSSLVVALVVVIYQGRDKGAGRAGVFDPSSPDFFLGPVVRLAWRLWTWGDEHYKGVSLRALRRDMGIDEDKKE